MSWNPIEGITAFFSGAATKVFTAVEKFLLQINIIGLNALEVVLFILFIALLIAMFAIPAKLYEYVDKFLSPLKKAFLWLRK